MQGLVAFVKDSMKVRWSVVCYHQREITTPHRVGFRDAGRYKGGTMASYLVDYENVQSSGLEGLDRLTGDDDVYIFYSDNADKITFAVHKLLNETNAQVHYVHVEVGHKNALDFQLATYLGYLIANQLGEQYFLVTRDNGFEAISRFWKGKYVRVDIASNLTGRSKAAIADELTAKTRALLGDTEEVPTVVGFIQKYKTKNGLNNALGKEYGSQRAGEIYKAIKPLIADKKGSDQSNGRSRSKSRGSSSKKNGNGGSAGNGSSGSGGSGSQG